MSRFRGKDTNPELRVRQALHSAGKRFRLHVRNLPGCPDIVLRKHRIVIMVHGCFWHAHQGCRIAHIPRTRREFWCAKFEANRARDERTKSELETLGWKVVTIWECEAKSSALTQRLLDEGLVAPMGRK